ncbi:MAG TPA: Cof-type HAD-IIB family hydrolase [Candidatus Xenobia bacterium]|nr:Cof-type HAD-IIB family hydrolase [Candidatus Xenobia bacterium]
MMTRIRLLAIDLDGTLLDTQSQISDANRRAVAAAHERGVEIVIVTGRRAAFAGPISAQLGCPYALLSSNGAVVKDVDGATRHRQLLPASKAREVLKAVGEGRQHALLLFDREGRGAIVVESLDPAHEPVEGYFKRNEKFLEQVVPLEAALTDDPIQVLFAGAVERIREVNTRLRQAAVAAEVSIALAEYPQRDLSLMDVLERGCNKGAALRWWTERRGLTRAQVMAIGDNWNDREMLEYAGLPVVMANASEELKGNGWAVTGSNDEDGVAAAIEKYLLTD